MRKNMFATSGKKPEELQDELLQEEEPQQSGGRKKREHMFRVTGQQFEKLQELHPEVESLSALLSDERGEEFRENLKLTGDLVQAYRLTWFEEILQEAEAAAAEEAVEQERARYAAASRQSGKAHLKRSQMHSGSTPEVTREMIEAYRVFDPEITVDEIRRFEAQYQKKKQ